MELVDLNPKYIGEVEREEKIISIEGFAAHREGGENSYSRIFSRPCPILNITPRRGDKGERCRRQPGFSARP